MVIKKYSHSAIEEWDAFVSVSKNGNLMHTQQFLSYHKNPDWNDCSLMFYKEEELVGVFPACAFNNEVFSHKGASYGGLIISKTCGIEDCISMTRLLLDEFNNVQRISFRSTETLLNSEPSDEVLFAAKALGFELDHMELSTVIDLENFQYSKNRLDKINRAQKKLEIRFDDVSYEDFHEILSNTLNTRYHIRPTHTLEEMHRIASLCGSNVVLVGAYLDSQLIGGIWMLKLSNKVYHTFYITHDYTFKSYNPVSFLLDGCVNYAKENGARYLNLGVSTEDQGDVYNLGLFNFKESFGGKGIIRCTFSKIN